MQPNSFLFDWTTDNITPLVPWLCAKNTQTRDQMGKRNTMTKTQEKQKKRGRARGAKAAGERKSHSDSSWW
jgi:hypothetical protein